MFFSNYQLHDDARIRKSLLWDYDENNIIWAEIKDVIIQRVVERGRIDDFYAILNLYGLDEVKESIKKIPYLNEKDLAFVCSVFGIKSDDLKCFSRKQLKNQHWSS